MNTVQNARNISGLGVKVVCLIASTYLSLCAQASSAASIVEYPLPTDANPQNITAGPDGNLWVTEFGANKIGRITPSGIITEFVVPTPESLVSDIVAGSDGNVWFTETAANKIGRITPEGAITEFPLPPTQVSIMDASGLLGGITSGPDGNLWFAERAVNKIGKISTSGKVSEFPVPTPNAQVSGIAAGPDGNLWFTELNGNRVGRITPAGVITEFYAGKDFNPYDPLDSLKGIEVNPFFIAPGPGNKMWFSGAGGTGNFMSQIGLDGTVITNIPKNTPFTTLVQGKDGAMWFPEFSGNSIDRLDASTGVVTTYPLPCNTNYPDCGNYPFGIANGPDGNIWFVETASNKIGKLTLDTGIAISPGLTGQWYDKAQSDNGINRSGGFSIEVLPGNQLLAQWFTFAPDGGQSWIVATGPFAGNTATLQGYQPVGSGGRFPPNFNSSKLKDQPWGKITLTFSDCNNGEVSWQPTAAGYSSGSMLITRLTIPVGLTCR